MQSAISLNYPYAKSAHAMRPVPKLLWTALSSLLLLVLLQSQLM